jgi:zinc/manganese transport system ATP-binding protein
MISFHKLGYTYGGPPVLSDISTQIHEGELVGIIGPSGSGKTTMLRILLGELSATVGEIRYARGSQVSIGYVPQLDTGERTFPITVEETVLLGAAGESRRRPWFDKSERRRALAILERLDILSFANVRLNELSGGQFQRVLIGRALMSRPTLLVLDEPTSGIDLKTRSQVLGLLKELQNDGFTVVLTTHDLNWVAAQLPRVLCLNRTIIADGAPVDVITSEVVTKTYGLKMDVLIHNGQPVVVDSLERN